MDIQWKQAKALRHEFRLTSVKALGGSPAADGDTVIELRLQGKEGSGELLFSMALHEATLFGRQIVDECARIRRQFAEARERERSIAFDGLGKASWEAYQQARERVGRVRNQRTWEELGDDERFLWRQTAASTLAEAKQGRSEPAAEAPAQAKRKVRKKRAAAKKATG